MPVSQYTIKNTVSQKKNVSRYLQFAQIVQIIDRIPSSKEHPIIISSLPERFWVLENAIIDYIRGKDVYVQFFCFEADLDVLKETEVNKPVNGRNFDITLNCDIPTYERETWSRWFNYCYCDFNASAYINLGDFCGLTVSNIQDFVNTLSEPCPTPIYNYINILTTARGPSHGPTHRFFDEYSPMKYAHKYTYVYEKVRQMITNPDAKETLYFPYRNNKSSLLSLSFAVGMPFLNRIDENTSVNKELFKYITNRNPTIQTYANQEIRIAA